MTYDDHHTFHETEQLDECKNLNASHFIVTKTSSSGLISPGNLLYLAVLLTMMKLHYVIRPKSTRVVVEVWWFPIQFTHSAYLANWASRKGKVNKLCVTWNRKRKRGLDIQAQCRIKFGSMLGGMNVSRLRKKAKDQKWFELTEDQQRRMYSLTDSMKKALDLDKSKIKGWRALTEEEVKESLEKEGKVQRWKIPGEVIKENGKEWLLNESMQMT